MGFPLPSSDFPFPISTQDVGNFLDNRVWISLYIQYSKKPMRYHRRRMSTPYLVGLYALIQHNGKYLLVRQQASSLPGGHYSLPGALLLGDLGDKVAELHLRRVLLSQLGLSVGELRLAGSHALRLTDGGTQLNLIFGAEYNSGVPNPQRNVILSADWIASSELRTRGDAPQWLMSAIDTYENNRATDGIRGR